MEKVKAINQLPPKTSCLKSIKPVVTNSKERIMRPSNKISTLIKRGLVEGVRSSDELGDSLYDDKEGRCPKAFRVDVDKFEVATTMMRNGDSTKNVTTALLTTDY